MHAYKSCAPEKLLKLQRKPLPAGRPISLQTNETEAHQRLQLQPAQPEWSDTLTELAIVVLRERRHSSGPSIRRQRTTHISAAGLPRLALATRA